MSEEELTFDPTMKKKRKKKTVADESKTAASVQETPAAVEKETQPEEAIETVTEEFKKLNKKKPASESARPVKPQDLETIDGEQYVSLLLTGDIDWSRFLKNKRKAETGEDEADLLGFDVSRRKKKKKTTKKITAEEAAAAVQEEEDEEGDINHTYEDLLENVFNIMRAKNPELVGGEKKPFVIAPPNIVRLGTKKTGFTNFFDICKMMHRDKDHLLSYLWTELGTSGSIDSANCLVIKGRFQQRQIETVLRSYIREFVTCHTCKSPSTMLAKQNRLYFLQCEACGSRRTVTSIKHGFQAVTGKRAAMRAKEQ